MDKQKCEKTPRQLFEHIKRNTLTAAKVALTIVFLMLLMEMAICIHNRRKMACLANAILLQTVFVDGGIEDLFDITDTEDSSSSDAGVFESHQPFVLELHDLVKDEPPAGTELPEPKVKKHRKKKGQPGAKQNPSSDTSSSVSESSVPPTGLEEHSREEFYDAHESYHGLTETQLAANPVTTAGLMQARSEHGPAPKVTAEQVAPAQPGQTQPGSGSRRQPSTITKPTGPQ